LGGVQKIAVPNVGKCKHHKHSFINLFYVILNRTILLLTISINTMNTCVYELKNIFTIGQFFVYYINIR